MLKKIVLGQLRHALAVGMPALIATGYVDPGQTEALIAIVLYAVSAAWSAVEKKLGQ